MITAIWPSYANLPNHLPASAAITTQGMVSYVIYHVIQTPFLFIPTHKLQYMFIFKSTLVPPMALAMVIWISIKAGGGSAIFHEPPTVHGAERAWLWLTNMTSITGILILIATSMSSDSNNIQAAFQHSQSTFLTSRASARGLAAQSGNCR